MEMEHWRKKGETGKLQVPDDTSHHGSLIRRAVLSARVHLADVGALNPSFSRETAMPSESGVWTELLNYVLEPLDLFNQGQGAPRTQGRSVDEGELPSAASQSRRLRGESRFSESLKWHFNYLGKFELLRACAWCCSMNFVAAAPHVLSLLLHTFFQRLAPAEEFISQPHKATFSRSTRLQSKSTIIIIPFRSGLMP